MPPMDNRPRERTQSWGDYDYNSNYNSRPHPSSPHNPPAGLQYYPPQSPHQAPPQYAPAAYPDGGHYPPPYAPAHPPYPRSHGPPPEYERNEEMPASATRRSGGQFQGHNRNRPQHNAQNHPSYVYPPSRNYSGYPPSQYPPPPPPPAPYPGYHYPGYPPPPPPPPDPYYPGYPNYAHPPPQSPAGWQQGPAPPPEHHGGQGYPHGSRSVPPRRTAGNNGHTFYGRHSLTWKPGKSNQPEQSASTPTRPSQPNQRSWNRSTTATDAQTNDSDQYPHPAFETNHSETNDENGSSHGKIGSNSPGYGKQSISASSWSTPLPPRYQDGGSQYQTPESGKSNEHYESNPEFRRRNTISSEHSGHSADRSNPNLEEGEIHSGEDETVKEGHLEDAADEEDDEEYSPPEPIEQPPKTEESSTTGKVSHDISQTTHEPIVKMEESGEASVVTEETSSTYSPTADRLTISPKIDGEETEASEEKLSTLPPVDEKPATDLRDNDDKTFEPMDKTLLSQYPSGDEPPILQKGSVETTPNTGVFSPKGGRKNSIPAGGIQTLAGQMFTNATIRPPPPPPPPPEEEVLALNPFDQEYYKTRRNSQSSQVTQAGSDFGEAGKEDENPGNENPNVEKLRNENLDNENAEKENIQNANPETEGSENMHAEKENRMNDINGKLEEAHEEIRAKVEYPPASKIEAVVVEEVDSRTRTPTPPNIGKGSLRSSNRKRRNPPEATRTAPKRRKD